MRDFEYLMLEELPNVQKIFRRTFNIHGADLEDLSQDTVIKALLHEQSFDMTTGNNGMRRWLSMIGINHFRDSKRRLKNKMQVQIDPDLIEEMTVDFRADPETVVIVSDLFTKSIAALVPLQRQSITEHALGYTAEEIGEHIDCTDNAVKGHIFRARGRLNEDDFTLKPLKHNSRGGANNRWGRKGKPKVAA